MPPTHAHDDAAVREKAYYLWEEDGKPHGRDQNAAARHGGAEQQGQDGHAAQIGAEEIEGRG